MTTVGEKTLQDVYDAFRMMLESHPDGVNAKSVWKEFFLQLHQTTISQAARILRLEGYLKKEGVGRSQKYMLTEKEYKKGDIVNRRRQRESLVNKPRPVAEAFQLTVFNGIILLMTKNPKGVQAMDLYREMFQTNISYSYFAAALSELERSGHLASKRTGKGKIYWPTGKQFLSSTPAVKPPVPTSTRIADKMKYMPPPYIPPQGLFKPKDPTDPNDWVDDMNKVLAALDKLEEAIPGLRLGLLDLCSHLERLSKVKDILAGVEKAARRNL